MIITPPATVRQRYQRQQRPVKVKRIAFERDTDQQQRYQTKQHLTAREYRRVQFPAVGLNQHIRISSKKRAQNGAFINVNPRSKRSV